MNVSSALYRRLFGPSEEEGEEQSLRSQERVASVREVVSRVGFKTEIVDWLQEQIKQTRIKPGPHEDMLYRTGFRDGLEYVLDRINELQVIAREVYDDRRK